MSNDNPDKPSDIARNIWLAGLGAYGKAIRDAQGKLEEAAREPPRLFRELVEKGSRLEDEVRDSLSSIRKTSSLSVEERIGRVRDTFHLNLGRSDEIEAINARLDALEGKLDSLAASLAVKPAPGKRAAKKAPVKKQASSRNKTAAKQASTRKAAAKKAASKKAATKKRAPAAKKAPARKKASAGKSAAPARRRR